MEHRWIAACLVAAAFVLTCRPALAQAPGAQAPAQPAQAAPHAKVRKRKAAAKPASAVPAAAAQPLIGSDNGSSLERQRRAFFAKPDEDGGTAPDATPAAGITLGGGGGITPGMGFKF